MERNRELPLLLFFLVIAIVIGLSVVLSRNKASAVAVPAYKGAEYCGGCHDEIYQGWNQTNHAHAVLLLQNATGNFYGIGATDNLEGTPSYNNETRFRSSCRNCHTTGGNNWDPINENLTGANRIWPEWNTTTAKFLNIQCEVCHGAFQSHGSTNPAMAIDYSSDLCMMCHANETSHDNSYWKSAHAQSLTDLLNSGHAADYCLTCMSTQGSLGFSVTLSTPDLTSISCVTCHDPHSHQYEGQIRKENSTELCGQCHSQAEVFENSAHSKAGLECVSCHGPGTHLSHGAPSPTMNHTWGVYDMFYPYNQTLQPVVCSNCHTQEWATSQLGVIQSLTDELVANATSTIDKAKAAITVANQTSGVDETELTSASGMIETAESILYSVNRDASKGFHNPEQTYTVLAEAARLANEAQSTALAARADALTTQSTDLQTQVSNLQNQVSTLEGQTSTLQNDIANLEAQIEELQSTAATAPYMYTGIGLAIGFAIGAAILFVLRRGKK